MKNIASKSHARRFQKRSNSERIALIVIKLKVQEEIRRARENKKIFRRTAVSRGVTQIENKSCFKILY